MLMKKILSLILCIALLGSCVALAGCDGEKEPSKDPAPATVKFGSSVYVSNVAATDASADANGKGTIDVTVAAVTVDADGKIVACDLDTMSLSVEYDAQGRAVGASEFKTKYELGDSYNMVAYGGAGKEWYAQADAFEGVVVGKNLDAVKALIVNGYKGNDEVIAAGCTIGIADFIGAVEKAYAAAADEVAADATVKVTAYTTQDLADATADKNGEQSLETYAFAAALNAEGKVITATSDCVPVKFTFDAAGKSTFDATVAIASKREQGDAYGMVAYGGAAKEWYAQADAFDAQCEGKNGEEIKGLMNAAGDAAGKGVEEVQNAGCTIYVSGLVAAASKI